MNLKKSIVNILCAVGDKFKPFVLKIIPLSLAKKLKTNLISSAYSTDSQKKPYENAFYPWGINFVAYIKAQMGLGQGGRLIASAILKTDIPFLIIDTKVGNPFNHNDTSFDYKIQSRPKYSVNVFHVNPEQMPPLQLTLPTDMLDKRYNIGIWLWELPEFPDEWVDAFRLVDEVWAPSVFNCESIRKKANVPVTLIPYGIEAKWDDKFSREYFNLPHDKFLFLCMYDSNSTIQRKNPIGTIKAFKQAFAKDDTNVGLVIKINNPKDEDISAINSELNGYQNVYFIKNTLSKVEVNSLIKDCDVFVSLHRAEGFGLVIAEAMYMGVPVIATNWSANVDFMTADNSCPVNYELKKIGQDYFLYKADQIWAEPDIYDASLYMKKLYSDKKYYNLIALNAEKYIKQNFSLEKSAEAINNRLSVIKGF